METPRTVEVVVKVPPRSIENGVEEFSLGHLSINTTVGMLRELIERAIPTHPPPHHQRILYSGRALIDNGQRISDAFSTARHPEQHRHFVHLVVRSEDTTGSTNNGDRSRVPITASNANNARIPERPPIYPAVHPAPSQPQQQQQGLNIAGNDQNGRREGFVVHHQQTIHHHPRVRPVLSQPLQQFVTNPGEGRDSARTAELTQARQALDGMGEMLAQLDGHRLSANELDQLLVELGRRVEGSGDSTVPPLNNERITRILSTLREERQADAERVTEVVNNLRRVHQVIDDQNERVRQQHIDMHRFAASPNMALTHPFMGIPVMAQRPHVAHPQHMPQPGSQPQAPQTNATPITCYLLSGPSGPHALLFDPRHGLFTNQQTQQAASPTATTTASPSAAANTQNQAQNQAGRDGAVPAGAMVGLPQNPPAQPAGQDALGPLQPILGHFWLMFRVLVFAWFVMGGNMGWRRPLAIFVIGVGFWFIRLGLFGENGVARRWWDDIMAVPRRDQPANQAQNPAQGVERQAQGQNRMPEPQEVAARLLNAQRNAQGGAMRELWIRFQRVFALLLASLWPGIGEAHVRAREEEERRQQEEEVAARRREEEERAKKEKDEAEKTEKGVTESTEKSEASEAVKEAESSEKAENHEKKG